MPEGRSGQSVYCFLGAFFGVGDFFVIALGLSVDGVAAMEAGAVSEGALPVRR